MVVLGVNAGPDAIADLEVFVNAFQISFPLLLDTEGVMATYAQVGAVSPFPLDYIIDQQGRVAYIATEYEPERMVAAIDSLLATSVNVDELPDAVSTITLSAAPNPFNPRTEIVYQLPQAGPVSLDLLDSRGRRVRRLLEQRHHAAGRHTLVHDGRGLASGVYLLRLQFNGAEVSRKLTLVR